MTAADVVVIVIIASSALFAFFTGFVRELIGLAVLGAAAIFTYAAWPIALPFVAAYLPDSSMAATAAVGATFATFYILALIAAHVAMLGIRRGPYGGIDRGLGAAFGLARGAVIVLVLYLGIDAAIPPPERPPWLSQAHSAVWAGRGADLVQARLPDTMARLSAGAAILRRQLLPLLDPGAAVDGISAQPTADGEPI
jgi:membrane protein required for colicin V production